VKKLDITIIGYFVFETAAFLLGFGSMDLGMDLWRMVNLSDWQSIYITYILIAKT